tara:strand:- start:466 stop:618 length:153 start_codon:yes stop_codon:yes gene_type:complete
MTKAYTFLFAIYGVISNTFQEFLAALSSTASKHQAGNVLANNFQYHRNDA